MKTNASFTALFAGLLFSTLTKTQGTDAHVPAHSLVPVNATAAQALCSQLPTLLQQSSSLGFNSTPVSYFYADGNHDSLESFAQSYPDDWIPARVNVDAILGGVGPDVNLRKDFGYGRQGVTKRARDIANHGPLGGSPAFCR